MESPSILRLLRRIAQRCAPQRLQFCLLIPGMAFAVSCDRPTTPEAVAPVRAADPAGRVLSDPEKRLPVPAMKQLRQHFPAYRLPLEQDELCKRIKQTVETDDRSSLQASISEGADVNWRPKYDSPPLFDAIETDRLEIVKLLIQNGAAITPKQPLGYPAKDVCWNAWGQTPLYYAARLGHLAIVQQLVAAGADVNAHCASGNTALNGALEGGHPAVVRFLLSEKATPDFERQVALRSPGNTVIHGDPPAWQEPPFKRTRKSLSLNLTHWIQANVDEEIGDLLQQEKSRWLDSTPERIPEWMLSAVLNNDVATFKTLLDGGAEPNAFYSQWNFLHYAASRGHLEMARLLLDAGIDVNEPTRGDDPKTAIEKSVRSGSVAMMQLLREHGADLPKDGTLLRDAVAFQHREMVQYLISAGDSVDAADIVETSLSTMPSYRPAKRTGSTEQKTDLPPINQMLVQAGAKIPTSQPASTNQSMPLEYRIASQGRLDQLKWLEKHRPVLYDDQLLRHAMESGNLELCRYAADQGAKLVPDSQRDQNLLRRVMVRFREPELTEFLFEQGIKKEYPPQFKITGYSSFHEYGHPLYHAALVGDIDFCRYLIHNFPDSDLTGPLKYEPYEYDSDIEYFSQGNSILAAPLFGDHWEILELLLTHSFQDADGNRLVDVNAKNAVGSTPLHTAVNYASTRCVQLLLAFGANALAVRDQMEFSDRRTPCHFAIHQAMAAHHHSTWPIEAKRLVMFPMLISSAMANDKQWNQIKTQTGRTILHEYAYAGSIDGCEKLVQLGANVNAEDNHRQTPLNLALRGFSKYFPNSDPIQYTQLCKVLVGNGTVLERANTPAELDYFNAAITSGLFPFADFLLTSGYDPQIKNFSGPLLTAAAGKGNRKFLEWLIQNGASIHATDYSERTALHCAVESGKIELCRIAIDAGADINAQDRDGLTPLYGVFHRFLNHTGQFNGRNPHTARLEKLAILNLLLSSGANPNLRSRYDRTVLQQYPAMPPEFRTAIEAAAIAHSQGESQSD